MALSGYTGTYIYGQPITLKATMTCPTLAKGTYVTGQVSFFLNNLFLGTNSTTTSTNYAIFTKYFLPGVQQVTAAYYGDANVASVFGTAVSFTVGKGSPTVVVTISPTSVGKNGSISITTVLSYNTGTIPVANAPTGTLLILANQTVFAVVNYTGVSVKKSYTNFTIGKTAVMVSYLGNSLFQARNSTSANINVYACPNPIPTTPACTATQHRLCCTKTAPPTWKCVATTVTAC